MALYNFTLTLSGVSYETEGLEDALYQARRASMALGEVQALLQQI